MTKILRSFKEVREYYGMSSYVFRKLIAPIRRDLDMMVRRRFYYNLHPQQVRKIIEYLGEPGIVNQ